MEEVFPKLDADGDGIFKLNEFQEVLRKLGADEKDISQASADFEEYAKNDLGKANGELDTQGLATFLTIIYEDEVANGVKPEEIMADLEGLRGIDLSTAGQ